MDSQRQAEHGVRSAAFCVKEDATAESGYPSWRLTQAKLIVQS